MFNSENRPVPSQNEQFLNQNSSEEQIKQYFAYIFRLKQSGEIFLVDLDKVWPIAYSRKKNAVNTLKNDFVEDVDYQTLTQKGKAGKHNSTIVHKYYLSIECMEYFIAKRVKPVFDVYRKVFHSKMGTILELRGSVKALEPLKDKGYIDARDLPYAQMQLNGVKVTTVIINGIQLYCLNEYQFAIGLGSDSTWTAKQMNLKDQNAVKVHLYAKSPMWFINEFAGNLLQSKAGIFQSNQLKLSI